MIRQSFTEFIKQCCAMREWNLRKMLKTTLVEHGFRLIEDDYKSRREGKYQEVHNLLAIRGERPKICLVAHTDVCRDHSFSGKTAPYVQPVVKKVELWGEIRKIIQDKNCSVQVGGDDRLGVAINMWIATHTDYDMGLLFCTDEEIGCVSSNYCSIPELGDFELLLQVDRGNHSNQLVTRIGGTQLCDDKVASVLLGIARDMGLPREKVNGLMTDVLMLRRNGITKQSANMTCGYHNSIGADTDEFIDIGESEETLQYVEAVIDYYSKNKVETENKDMQWNFEKEIEYWS